MSMGTSKSTDTEVIYSAAGEVGAVRKRRTFAERNWIILKKAPLTAWFGMIVFCCYIVVAVFAPWLAPFGEAEVLKSNGTSRSQYVTISMRLHLKLRHPNAKNAIDKHTD